MFMTDVSTPLNRTRTLTPLLASYSTGLALGPAVGGMCIGLYGLSTTYMLVGVSFAVLSLINNYTLAETKDLYNKININSNNINNMGLLGIIYIIIYL